MRAVIDTNVLLSGLFWHGPSHRLLEHVRDGSLELITSPALLAELTNVLDRAKFRAILERTDFSHELLLAGVRQMAEIVDPLPLPLPVCSDPDDDKVLALALAVSADLIISGDDDLLVLMNFEGIPIVTPAQALTRIGVT